MQIVCATSDIARNLLAIVDRLFDREGVSSNCSPAPGLGAGARTARQSPVSSLLRILGLRLSLGHIKGLKTSALAPQQKGTRLTAQSMTNFVRAPVVLIVEDEPFTRRVSAFELEDAGYEVLQASFAGEALDMLTSGTAVGLLITDVNMPGGVSGLELARQVCERWPQVQVIVTSGAEYIRPNELPQGARILLKPYTLDNFRQLVTDLVGAPGFPF